ASGQGRTYDDPDAASIRLMQEDQTEAVVEIWEKEFEKRPYDDTVRETLHLTLLAHVSRSLDKGELRKAQDGFSRAKELIPTFPTYAYFEETLNLYGSMIAKAPMNGSEFEPANSWDFESRFVEILGIFGGQSKVFALTSKEADNFNWYQLSLLRQGSEGVAIRFLTYPMGSNGTIHSIVGVQPGRRDYISAALQWTGSSSADLYLGIIRNDEPSWSNLGYVSIEVDQWHIWEVRMRGNTLQLWIDMELIAQEIVLDYEPGSVGFGVGLNSYQAGSTFSAAFDDFVVYSLGKSQSL